MSMFTINSLRQRSTGLHRSAAAIHPLMDADIICTSDPAAQTSSFKSGSTDHLTRLMEGCDPLTLLAIDGHHGSAGEYVNVKDASMALENSAADEWNIRRRAILSEYTTDQLVTVATTEAAVATTSRAKARLAQLEPTKEEATSRSQLTSQAFVGHMNQAKRELQEAWKSDQRVNSLKIVIQACKTLEEVTVPQFYPSMFVQVVDILDTFGGLVHARISTKDAPPGCVAGGARAQLSEGGRETCRNWFYKVASIRELVARLYVEMAILHCYDLLEPGGAEAAAMRLVPAIRGIASPIAAAFARAYLSKVAPPSVHVANFEDAITCLNPRTVAPSWKRSSVSAPVGARRRGSNLAPKPALAPAIDWCAWSAIRACAESRRDVWLEEVQERNAGQGSSVVLMALLRSAGSQHLALRCIQYVQAVASCADQEYRPCDLLACLGEQLTRGDVPAGDRLHALNAAWRQIQQLSPIDQYMTSLSAWCRYVAKYFGSRQLAVLLADARDRLSVDRQFEQCYPQLQSLITAAAASVTLLTQLVKLESFTSLLELLQDDAVRFRVHRHILELMLEAEAEQLKMESCLVELGMTCCKVLHDGVNMLSLDDERRDISGLLCRFLQSAVDAGRPHSALDLLVQARGSFYNLEPVTTHLIQAVHHLAAVVPTTASGGRRSFVAACVAYCFITLPGLTDVVVKLKLYLVTAQVALAHGCLGQADACVRAAVTGLADMPPQLGPQDRPRSVLPATMELVKSLLSTLLIFPDQPGQSPLYLVSGTLAALQRLSWLQSAHCLPQLYLDVLRLLCALAQPQYLYTADAVDANDTLYGGDAVLMDAIDSLSNDVIARMTSYLQLDSPSELLSRDQAMLAGELLIFLNNNCEMKHSAISNLSRKICQKFDATAAPPAPYQEHLREARSRNSKMGNYCSKS